MTDEKQQVKEAIAEAILLSEEVTCFDYQCCLDVVDTLLNLKHPNGQPMIGILTEKQELPTNCWNPNSELTRGWNIAIKEILKAGYKQCI